MGTEVSAPAASIPEQERVSHETTHSQSRGHGKRPGRRPKQNFLIAKLAAGWVLLLILIVLAARHFWRNDANSGEDWKQENQNRMSQEDVELIQQNGTACQNLLAGFLASGAPETLSQYVLRPVSTVRDMTRFYGLNPQSGITGGLSYAGMSVLHLPGGEKALEGIWKSPDGQMVDAVFRREREEWKIDWHHLVRYGDYPWSLYLAGSGEAEGEFRLHARQRAVEDPEKTKPLSVVFYAPRFGYPMEAGAASPEFEVPRESPAGRLLDAAFEAAEKGEQPFGGFLEKENPDGMIRVRVKIRRTDEEMKRSFELLEVAACHWLELDDPGVIPISLEDQEEEDSAKE